MDRATYDDLKKLARQRADKVAEEAYQEDLAAIDRLWATAHANGAPLPSDDEDSQPKQIAPRRQREPGSRGKILADVRSVLKDIQGTFNSSHVRAKLAEEKPGLHVKTGTLKAILKKLSEKGEIEIVSQGAGRRPTQYRRK